MKITKIYFDMDGVLADFVSGVREICGMEPVSQDASTEDDNRQWEAIKDSGHFYDMLELMPGALEMYKRLSSKYDCEILTAVPKEKRHIENAGEDKIKWVRRLLSKDMKINIVLKEDKKDYAKGKDYILIDDLHNNITLWEDFGGTGVCFKSAEDVLKKIEELENA